MWWDANKSFYLRSAQLYQVKVPKGARLGAQPQVCDNLQQGRPMVQIQKGMWSSVLRASAMYLRHTWKCEVGAHLGLKRLIWG